MVIGATVDRGDGGGVADGAVCRTTRLATGAVSCVDCLASPI
jgi:hypothetical protein